MSSKSNKGGRKRAAPSDSPPSSPTHVPNPYRNYKKAKVDWLEMFAEVEKGQKDNPPTRMTAIANKHNMPLTTLNRRYHEWVRNGRGEVGTTDKRGGQNRTFTEEEEADIARDVRQKFTNIHRPIVDEDFHEVALSHHTPSITAKKRKDFKASHRFVHRFKRQHHFVSHGGRPHKVAVNVATEDDIKKHQSECSKHLDRVGSDLFIGFDETHWPLVHCQGKFWFNQGKFLPSSMLIQLLSLL